MVMRWSAKPVFAGSIPALAFLLSKFRHSSSAVILYYYNSIKCIVNSFQGFQMLKCPLLVSPFTAPFAVYGGH